MYNKTREHKSKAFTNINLNLKYRRIKNYYITTTTTTSINHTLPKSPPQVINYSLISLSKTPTSPPASLTNLRAASESFRLLSNASFSRLAFVFELPLGATPVKILFLSSGVKLTKPNPLLAPLAPEAVFGVRGVRGLGVLDGEVLDLVRRW